MRQTHVAGEKLFVDFAGDTVAVIDPATGEVRAGAGLRRRARRVELHLCRGALERRAWPTGSAPTSTRSPSSAACRGDRLRQPQGRRHRRLPLRARHQPHLPGARRPLRHRDPADPGPQAARQGQGRGRRCKWSSAGSWPGCATGASSRSSELNAAIRELLDELNGRLMRKLGASRRELFETIDRPALAAAAGRTLSSMPSGRSCRVAPDYHVELVRALLLASPTA